MAHVAAIDQITNEFFTSFARICDKLQNGLNIINKPGLNMRSKVVVVLLHDRFNVHLNITLIQKIVAPI